MTRPRPNEFGADESSPGKSSRDHFDALSDKYASSTVHRFGASLALLLEYAAPNDSDTALDVATGPGTTAFALAPFVGQVTGLDVSPQMLAQARARAELETVANISFLEGAAEQLPFLDASFTLVTSRHAPHHFRDLPAFLREVKRVLAAGGRFVLADQITPAEDLTGWVDTWQQTRDPSHYRQRTISEWHNLATEAGFSILREQIVPYRLEFDWWTQQAGCSAETVEQLRRQAREASPAVRQAMKLEFDEAGQVVAHHDPVLVARFETA